MKTLFVISVVFLALFTGLCAQAKTKTTFPLIGSQYFLDTLGAPLVTVLGVEGHDEYVIHYDSGNFEGQIGRSWHASDFLRQSGCVGKGFCVGDRYLVPDRGYVEATIVGVGEDGEMVLHFESGEYAGSNGDGWHKEDLLSISYEHFIQR